MLTKLTSLKGLLLIVMCLLLTLGSKLNAQDSRVITGVVKNKKDSLTLPDVTVYLKGKTTSAVKSDVDGSFKIKVPAGEQTLVFSSVGMENKEVPITAQSSYTVYMKVTIEALNDVVVVGYGTQKKSLVTGAITSIKQADLETPGIMRADQAIQGRVPGVTVMQNSGQPGSGVSIRIRGAGTNGSTDPLYIIDGYPVTPIPGNASIGLEDINPRDIESMEILKDAASAAIYGARGANGVVIITTKKGKKGRTKVDYDYYYGIQNMRKYLDVLDATQYARIINESYFNSNLAMPFSEDEISKMGKGTNWQKEIAYQNAPIQSHQLSLTSGSENSSISASFSYFSQDGTIAKGKSNFTRYTGRVNAEQKYLDGILTAGENVTVTQVNRASIASNSVNAGPILGAINMDPVTPVMNDDGTFAISRYISQEVVNPVARLYYTNGGSSYTRMNGNGFAELKLGKDFRIKTTLAYTIEYDESHGYQPIYYLNATNYTLVSGASKAMAVNNWFNFENVLTYKKNIGQHNITALVGNTVNTGNGTDVSGSKNGLLYDDPAHAYLNLAKDNTSASAGGGAWHSGLISYFGRVNYDYAGKYLLTATYRADGSYRFGPANKFGFFPSVSAGWNVTRENFMKNINWVNSLKLRASWGQVGSDNIGDYRYVSTISTTAMNYYFGQTSGQYIGAVPGSISNPDLKWETSEQSNIGIDVVFLKNFTGTLDFYSKLTKGLLVTIPIPLLVGNQPPVGNAGNVSNKGIELSIGYHNNVGKLFYDVTLNGAYNVNNVTYVGNALGFISGASANNQMTSVTRMQAGFPLGYFWLYTMDGIFQNQAQINSYRGKDGTLIQPNAVPGDIRYKDLNGDGKIDNNDRSMVGSPHPKYNFGLNITLKYKNFDFNVFAYGLAGNKIFNALRRWDLPTANYQTTVLNRWHGEGTSNNYPRVSTGDLNGNFSNPSTFFLEDGSFIRLKNVSLGYNVKWKGLKAAKISSLRVYATGSNLLVLTKYTGLDPEVAGSSLGLGIDNGVYPQPRTVTFGVSVGF
ncbi:SusC/RagA family TonB-linked outer membrane protein [Chitinophagaceae bacterium LWZ2-11]